MNIKHIFGLLCLTTGLCMFQACSDVPAPYDIPAGDANSIYGTGTLETPYTVRGAALNQNGGLAWVKAYIVGYIPQSTGDDGPSYTISDVMFSTDGAPATNIVIADNPTEKDINNCMAVQLPSGDVRSALNLADHPENIGKEIMLYGTMERYYGGSGVKSVTAAILDGQEIGDMPEEPGEAIFSADFSSSLSGFTSVSASGSLSWYNDFSSAMITGWINQVNYPGVTYLISPTIDLSQTTEAYVAINMALNYERGDMNTNNSVLISKNYTGDVNSATWTQLTYDTDGLNDSFSFRNKEMAIPAELMGGSVTIALRHTCTETYSSTWEVKSLQILEGKATEEGDTQPSEDEFLNADFSSSLAGFTSVAASGSLSWYNDFSSAMVTGFQDFDGDGVRENQAGVTYLVSPTIDLSNATEAYVAVNMAINYKRGDLNEENSILISKNYNGDVNTATWTQLTYNTDGLGSSFTFMDKEMAIPTEFLGGNVVIALRHTCNDTESTTWEVKELKVLAGKAGEQGGEEPEPTPGGEGDALIVKNGTTVTMTNPNVTASATVTTTDFSTFGWQNAGEPTGASDSEGTMFVFAQEEGRNPPLFYSATGGVRMYALNSLTLQTEKPIAKVILTCDSYQGTDYVGNEQLYVAIDGNNWTVVNDFTGNSGGTQLRIKTIEITYAE